jgi:putative ABC transport system permease protein
MNPALSRLRHLLRPHRLDAELQEEMETHRALRQEALERQGVPAEAAHVMSRRALGNVSLAVEDARDVWVLTVVAVLAAWVPAWRAAQLEPATVLRDS